MLCAYQAVSRDRRGAQRGLEDGPSPSRPVYPVTACLLCDVCSAAVEALPRKRSIWLAAFLSADGLQWKLLLLRASSSRRMVVSDGRRCSLYLHEKLCVECVIFSLQSDRPGCRYHPSPCHKAPGLLGRQQTGARAEGGI
ncbi:hypothetical protein F2P79_001879 [Pimephales promelas]|nr:hypothetical protein F2P79_001879 [Pimephales promelas]